MDETAIWKPADIRKLLNEVSGLRAERDEMKANYLDSCQTIAAMHAAATGKPGDGSRRGVVEDIENFRAEKEQLEAWAKRAYKWIYDEIVVPVWEDPTATEAEQLLACAPKPVREDAR